MLLFQERLTAAQIVGGAAVLAGAVLVTWPGKKRRDPGGKEG